MVYFRQHQIDLADLKPKHDLGVLEGLLLIHGERLVSNVVGDVLC